MASRAAASAATASRQPRHAATMASRSGRGTPNASSSPAWLAGSARPICSCCPCTSTSSEAARRSSATPTGWSLMNARERPSFVRTRRSTTSSSASSPCSISSAVSGCPGGGAKQAVTPACAAPGPHQCRVRPRAQRQTETVEQDRLAGAGLAGQHRQARAEGQVQPLDQHHVADRKRGEHSIGARSRCQIKRAPCAQKTECQAREKNPRSSGLRGGPACCTRPLSNRLL